MKGWGRSNLGPRRRPAQRAKASFRRVLKSTLILTVCRWWWDSDYLVGCPGEEWERHGTLGRAGAKLLRHVCEAVPKSTSLVNNPLGNEFAFPPLVIASGPPDASKSHVGDSDLSA